MSLDVLWISSKCDDFPLEILHTEGRILSEKFSPHSTITFANSVAYERENCSGAELRWTRYVTSSIET